MGNIIVAIVLFILSGLLAFLSYRIATMYRNRFSKEKLNWWKSNRQWFYLLWAVVFLVAAVTFLIAGIK